MCHVQNVQKCCCLKLHLASPHAWQLSFSIFLLAAFPTLSCLQLPTLLTKKERRAPCRFFQLQERRQLHASFSKQPQSVYTHQFLFGLSLSLSLPLEGNGYMFQVRNLVQKQSRIFVRGHYLFREANSFSEQIMSKNKYASTFLPQIETNVFIILQIFFTMQAVLKIGDHSVM